MKKSVQQLIDEKMCRPGYRWNDTLKRCLAEGGGVGEVKPPEESIAPEPAAPAKPASNGRGEVRVNSGGVKQSGTSMGKSIAIK
jgi:hypothetical protein